METKSNYVWVGIVTLGLLIALVAFTFWLSRFNEGEQKEYDIFFQQAVSGLAKGSSVSFAGVPVGKVVKISLWEPDPEYVRVRIKVDGNVPVLQGTVATIAGIGFTGVSEIQLDGAVKDAPAITCPTENPETACPGGAPIIPTKPGALGELLNNAPLLLERLSTLTERMTAVLSDQNQESIEQMLANMKDLSGNLAATSPQLNDVIADTRITMQKTGNAADQISALTGSATLLIEGEGTETIKELQSTLKTANKGLSQLEKTLKAAQPGVTNFSEKTVPEISALTRELQEASRSIKNISERLDQEGAGSLIGAPPLPDYEP